MTFQNEIDTDLIPKLGQGNVDIGIADGTDVIPAVSQGIPIKYLATIYGQFPSIVFSKATAGIDGAAKLKGKKLGIPGKYGSSWVMLQALLASASLKPDDLQIVEYPDFGQGAAVAAGAVDAATGFANNEPVQLELAGTPTTVLHVDDDHPAPGPRAHRRDDRARDQAGRRQGVRRGDAARDAGDRRRPERRDRRGDQGRAGARQRATDPGGRSSMRRSTSWTGPTQTANGLGALDADGWAKSIAYLTTLGLVPNAVTVQDVLAEGYVPGA